MKTKRFRIEAHCIKYTCKFEVEIGEEKGVSDTYHANDTSYVFDDVDGCRHIIPRTGSLIDIVPLIPEITYKDKVDG